MRISRQPPSSSFFVLSSNINTVLNNAYAFGSTFFDSAFFQTIIWRSGWALLQPPTIATDMSYLNVHFSPINYLPNIVSYFVPIDRMTYYGVVYGTVYACLVVFVFDLFLRLPGHRTLIAALGSFLFYLSGPVNSGQWEPHQEVASALFTAGFFVAWGLQRRWAAAAMLALDVMVRKDCGVLLAFPLFLLWAHEWWAHRRTGLGTVRQTLGYAVLAAVLSVAAFIVKRVFFDDMEIFSHFYYGEHPFSHLSQETIAERLQFILQNRQYLWMPGLVLLAGAIWLRDARLVIGWVAFLPYWLFNFFSVLDLNAGLGEAERLDSIFWFNGDRDQPITMKWLERGQFPYFYRVIGTRLRLATRSSPDMVPTFAGAIEPIQTP